MKRQPAGGSWVTHLLCCRAPPGPRGDVEDHRDDVSTPNTEEEPRRGNLLSGPARVRSSQLARKAPEQAPGVMCGLDEGATDKRRRDADEPSRSGDIVPAGKDGSEDGMLIYSVEVARRAEVEQTTRKLGATIPPGGGWSGWPNKLLGSVRPGDAGKNTLVLDLDETLVHSSFQPPIGQADYVIPIDIEGRVVKVHVTKRPHLDEFLEYIAGERPYHPPLRGVGKTTSHRPLPIPIPVRGMMTRPPLLRFAGKFEVVVFTASLAKYADPLLDLLDKNKCISWRLFRDACHNVQGNYVKNLECLGRDAGSVIIVDNSPHSYVFQPENALPIPTFIDDPLDTGVLSLIPYLERLRYSRDVRKTLAEMGVDPFPED